MTISLRTPPTPSAAGSPPPRATLHDLLDVKGKVELIAGRLVEFPMPGDGPCEFASGIYIALKQYARQTRRGQARNDGLDYAVGPLQSGRESFRPDASYYTQPRPINRMLWVDGPPDFAVEVRSQSDYGRAAELEMAAKRADYFEAGTLVVWDVDPVARTVTAYRRSAPAAGTVFAMGEVAEAEPAVPGWSMPVEEVFAD